MRVTVCQLPDDRHVFDEQWRAFCAHAQAERADLAVLPEMPFAPWFATQRPFDEAIWRAAEEAHARWAGRFKEIGVSCIAYSRPATSNGQRRNEGVITPADSPENIAHIKRYLPDEPGFWEASWYQSGDGAFHVSHIGGTAIGFQICTDLWFFEEARKLGLAGAEIIACPRATPEASAERWLTAGRAAAISAGAFSISSNRCGAGGDGVVFGGAGWIIDPDGEILARTSEEVPFATREIDLEKAREAKRTYPRYVR